ncbi:hypothetical protein Cylst_5174 [Cylindrospermum stagnale PCC 7417]|uniref:Uncharacterized protein n=1 Tax=Cylindrospermum stagnale PCC 7417 TaxID=56107 RepID=K9X533_9NOST|nr:hypothetical protein [Cylindrospermum stagnale]AFZ27214.1 hypothetical protein Cylst_5174 [Cylindrospermum stagnale PCC 7417]
MKRDFADFWSINHWLCQYRFFIEDDNSTWIDEEIIVTPTSDTPYHVTDYLKYKTVEKANKYLRVLDENTFTVCTFEQKLQGRRTIPAMEIVVFPCPDKSWYAGYPALNPQHYVRVCDFYSGDKDWLENGQYDLAFASRRIWSSVLRES